MWFFFHHYKDEPGYCDPDFKSVAFGQLNECTNDYKRGSKCRYDCNVGYQFSCAKDVKNSKIKCKCVKGSKEGTQLCWWKGKKNCCTGKPIFDKALRKLWGRQLIFWCIINNSINNIEFHDVSLVLENKEKKSEIFGVIYKIK